LVGDAGKGVVAVMLAQAIATRYPVHFATVPAAALAVFLGHLWPVFFEFSGGKGVATAGGILLALAPWLGLATLATWLVVFALFRISSPAAISAAVCAPLWTLLLEGLRIDAMFLAVLAISVLLLIR